MTLDEFKFLNPAHNKRVINSNSAETVVLPKHKVPVFMANMSQNEDKPLVSMKTHTVQAGDRPEAIAAQYGITVGELNQLNNIGGRRRIATGQTLIVPNRTDLQPELGDIRPPKRRARPVAYARTTMVRKVVVTRGGVRRTVTVAVPVRQVNMRAAVNQAHAARGAAQAPRRATAPARAPVKAAGKPAVQKIAYQPAAAKAKRN